MWFHLIGETIPVTYAARSPTSPASLQDIQKVACCLDTCFLHVFPGQEEDAAILQQTIQSLLRWLKEHVVLHKGKSYSLEPPPVDAPEACCGQLVAIPGQNTQISVRCLQIRARSPKTLARYCNITIDGVSFQEGLTIRRQTSANSDLTTLSVKGWLSIQEIKRRMNRPGRIQVQGNKRDLNITVKDTVCADWSAVVHSWGCTLKRSRPQKAKTRQLFVKRRRLDLGEVEVRLSSISSDAAVEIPIGNSSLSIRIQGNALLVYHFRGCLQGFSHKHQHKHHLCRTIKNANAKKRKRL